MSIRKMPIVPGLAFALLLASGCSVKELRDECPVYVTVLTDRFIQQGLQDGVVSFHGAEPIGRKEINFLTYIGKGYVQPCPREYARAAVLSGVENEHFVGTALAVPYGKQAGLIWSYGETFSVHADEYLIDAEPRKQYCLVKFLFDESPVAPPGYNWRFRIKAECNGLDIYTMEPVEGAYCCPVGPNAVGEWYGVIPRQKSNNMILEVYTPYADSETEGKTEYVLDLGRRFEEKGYDWTRDNLSDIAVRVGFTSAEIILDVQDWTGDDSYRNIEI